MPILREEQTNGIKFIPTKRLNVHQVYMSPNDETNNKTNDFRNIKSKSNADISNIIEIEANNKNETQETCYFLKNTNRPSETTQNKRIYENEFTIRTRAKSVESGCVIRNEMNDTTNLLVENNISIKKDNLKINNNFVQTSLNSNYQLNNSEGVNDQEMLRMGYRRANNRYQDIDPKNMMNSYYNRIPQQSYHFQSSSVAPQKRRVHSHRQLNDIDWVYEYERERIERSEFNRSRRLRRVNQMQEMNNCPEFVPKNSFPFRNERSQSNDSKLNDIKPYSSSSADDSSTESANQKPSPSHKPDAVVETGVQTSTHTDNESKLVNELRSQMDILKAEIARLQNAQTNLEKNLKQQQQVQQQQQQQQQQNQQQQQQNTILRPIIYSGTSINQSDYDEYTLDQFIQNEDSLFSQAMTSYADFYKIQNQSCVNNFMNTKQFMTPTNIIQPKVQQQSTNQPINTKQNENRNLPKQNVQNIPSNSTLPRVSQPNIVPKNMPPLMVQNKNVQPKVNISPKVIPGDNASRMTPLNIQPVQDLKQSGPSSPNAQLYQKLLKLVSDSVDLTDTELSNQMNTLLTNPHIKNRLKQLHSQLLQDPNHYWPKLESILLFDSQGKDGLKFETSLQNKLQNVIHDLIDLKKYYSEAAPGSNKTPVALNRPQFAQNPRILNREFKN